MSGIIDTRYPKNLGAQDDFPAQIRFTFFKIQNAMDYVGEQRDRVVLYMPESASQPSTVSWTNEKFGFIGAGLARTGGEVRKVYNAGGDWNESLRTGMAMGAGANTAYESFHGALDLGTAKAMAGTGSSIAQFLGGNVTTEGLMGAVAGKIPNPYLTCIFQGIDFRSFAFTFKFYPFDESDCQDIFDIYQTFRKNALPEYVGGEKTFLGYPHSCEIEYLWNGDVNPWLHRFKRSVCTAVDIDYTAAGMFSVMRNGFPSEIVMSTKWTEMELVTAEEVVRSVDPAPASLGGKGGTF